MSKKRAGEVRRGIAPERSVTRKLETQTFHSNFVECVWTAVEAFSPSHTPVETAPFFSTPPV